MADQTETTWTTGPWHYYSGSHSICGVNDRSVCVVIGPRSYNEHRDPARADERDANARLIAAAPDLYEALKALVGAWKDAAPQDADDDLYLAIDQARQVLSQVQS